MNLCFIANLENEYWPNCPVVLEKISISERKKILINSIFVTRFVEIGLTSGSGEDVERMQIDMQSSET